MALVTIPGGINMNPGIGMDGFRAVSTTQTNTDAVGEGSAFIGLITWEDGATHTVSSSGGKIYWIANASTFSNAGTTIRVGIQDVDPSTGLEDGTFDVYDDLVGGTDTITASVITTTTMSTGSKSIAHNSLIAVAHEMTARGGSDSIAIRRVNGLGGFPYATWDIGAGPVAQAHGPYCMVEADDGTLGVLGPPLTIPQITTTTAFHSGSTPDEYAMIFQVPFKCTINQLTGLLGEVDAGETGELILYTTPTGTPTAVRTAEVDPETFGIAFGSVGYAEISITEYTLEANTTYAVAYRPTTTGARSINRVTSIPSANARKFAPFGTTLQGGTRSDQSGAFSTSNTEWPMLGFTINKLDDGASSGGGASSYVF